MKHIKKFLAALGLASLLVPTFVFAATFRSNENVTVNETVLGNLYLAGSNVVMGGNVSGDLIMAGSNVNVPGNVGQDLAVVGGTISVTGKIGGDVRVVAGTFNIDNEVGGEVIALGGNIIIGKNAIIHGDLIISGSSVEIDPAAKIEGKQTVHNGDDNKQEVEEEVSGMAKLATPAFWLGLLFSLLAVAVVGILFFGLYPKFVRQTVDSVVEENAFWSNFGIGLAVFFLMPIVALFCLLSGVGYLLALALLFGYVAMIFLVFGYAGVLFGGILQRLNTKTKKLELSWKWILGGILALHLLTTIPVVGGLIGFVMMIVTIGALMRVKWAILKKM